MDPFAAPSRPTSSRSSSVTLSSFLGRFGDVVDELDGYVVHCPAHTDSHPSLRVAYNAEERKLALKCRAGCKVPEIVDAMGLKMADLFNVEPGDEVQVRTVAEDKAAPSTADKAALAFYLDRANTAAADYPPVFDYAFRRFGLTTERFLELGLGYDNGELPGGHLKLSRGRYHDAPRLVVPFNDFSGRPHYLQARDLTGTAGAKWSGPVNPEGAAWGKYGFFPGGTGWHEVLVTEGPGDALTAAAVGYDTVLIRGASLLNDNPALADELAAALKGRVVVVAGDADEAGGKFTRAVCENLSERGVDTRRLTISEALGDLSKWQETTPSTFAKDLVIAVQGSAKYGTDHILAESIRQEITRLYSDVYNAKALLGSIRERGFDVKWTTEVGFVLYDPEGTWQIDEAKRIRAFAHEVAAKVQTALLRDMESMDARVAAIADKELREEIGRLLDRQRAKVRNGGLVARVESTQGIDAMLRELSVMPGVFARYEDFDQHPDLLAVGNGIVDLRSGELEKYTEETKDLLLMRRLAVDYDPDASNPRWELFVKEIFSSYPDLPEYLQRLIGYGITGRTTEQALAVLHGTGSNGKSVLLDTLTGVFRGITVNTPFSTFEAKPSGGIPNDIAALKGARLVMASEGEQGRPMAEALIKRLTGGDTVSARFMHKEFFEFKPTFLILLATNYRPNFRGQDFGLWRRVKLIPFDRTFPVSDRDPYLTAKLLGERVPASAYRQGEDFGDGASGILAWAVRGAVAWYREGLGASEVIEAATVAFKANSDKLGPFYDEHLVKELDAKITGKEVWELYRDWVDAEDLPSKERWTRSTFWSALEERGAVKRKSGGTFYFRGIRKRRPHEHGSENPEVETRADQTQLADLNITGAAPSLDGAVL